MWTSVGRGAAGLALAVALSGCGKPATLSVAGAWVRLPAVPGRPAAGYLTLHGGAADATLVRVATPAARRAELHESMAGGMRRVAALPVPAAVAVALAPGGRHLMLFDPDPRLAAGGSAPLTLEFADGRRLAVTARVVGPADAAPHG